MPVQVGYLVNTATRSLIEEFDPGVHNFWPVELRDSDGVLIEEERRVLILGARLQTIDEERSDVKFAYSKYVEGKLEGVHPLFEPHDYATFAYTPDDLEAVRNNPAPLCCDHRKIGGHHMWGEDKLGTSKLGEVFVTNAFFEALIAHGIGGLKPVSQFHEF